MAHVESKEADDERGAVGDHVEAIGDERQRVDREADEELDEEEADDEEQNDEHARRASERAPTPRAAVRRPFVRPLVRPLVRRLVRVLVRLLVRVVVVVVVRVRTSRGSIGGTGREIHRCIAALDVGHIRGRKGERHSVAGG